MDDKIAKKLDLICVPHYARKQPVYDDLFHHKIYNALVQSDYISLLKWTIAYYAKEYEKAKCFKGMFNLLQFQDQRLSMRNQIMDENLRWMRCNAKILKSVYGIDLMP